MLPAPGSRLSKVGRTCAKNLQNQVLICAITLSILSLTADGAFVS